MTNFEKWFEKAFILLDQNKNYEAIRNFNGAIFRIISKKVVIDKPKILIDIFNKFFSKLSELDLFHEISQILSYYFNILRKNSLANEYIEVILEIPLHNDDISLGFELFSICLMKFENIQNADRKDFLFSTIKKKYNLWMKRIENNKLDKKIQINLQLLLFRILTWNGELENAFITLNSLYEENKTEIENNFDEDENVYIILLLAYLFAINDDMKGGLTLLKNIRKSSDNIANNNKFKIGLDILPSIHSQDSDWFIETKDYVISKLFDNQKYSKLIVQFVNVLQKENFPETINSRQLLDFF
ncbi:MAG: hypothetical protein HeimC3_26930 [Candidatus Heimdallarchaeota archaeon LC_3]|nr:MAG: hypothetical protein HeimC3_26930 [Candidatus Heimdallarchaeota archaeon LC_3]